MSCVDVGDQGFELVFGALRSEVGDLWLEAADEVGGGVDKRLAKYEDGGRFPMEVGWELRGIRIKTDAEQGIVLLPGGSEGLGEGHGVSLASFWGGKAAIFASGRNERTDLCSCRMEWIAELTGCPMPREALI